MGRSEKQEYAPLPCRSKINDTVVEDHSLLHVASHVANTGSPRSLSRLNVVASIPAAPLLVDTSRSTVGSGYTGRVVVVSFRSARNVGYQDAWSPCVPGSNCGHGLLKCVAKPQESRRPARILVESALCHGEHTVLARGALFDGDWFDKEPLAIPGA